MSQLRPNVRRVLLIVDASRLVWNSRRLEDSKEEPDSGESSEVFARSHAKKSDPPLREEEEVRDDVTTDVKRIRLAEGRR